MRRGWGDKSIAVSHLPKTSYKKLGYPISLSYIYLLSPYKGQRNFKTDLDTQIPVRIFRQMKKVMTIREFESWLDQMDNRLEEANKNGRPLIVEDLFVHSGK